MREEDQPTAGTLPWPIGLARHVPRPGLTLGTSATALMAAGMWACGAYDPTTTPPAWGTSEQSFSFGIAYPALVGYIIGISAFSAARSERYLNALRPLLDTAGAPITAKLNRVARGHLWWATIGGLIVALLNIDTRTVLGLGKAAPQAMDLALALGSMTIWLLSARLLCVRLHNALLFGQLGRDHTAVDLFRPHTLRPFGYAGILDLLIVMGVLALTPLQALDAQFRLENYFWALAIGLPAAVVVPWLGMRGARHAIARARRDALAALDGRIAAASREPDDRATLHLNSLLDRRRYLTELHDWPIDLRTLWRAGFYVVIPPLAWVGAALVEIVVDALISG